MCLLPPFQFVVHFSDLAPVAQVHDEPDEEVRRYHHRRHDPEAGIVQFQPALRQPQNHIAAKGDDEMGDGAAGDAPAVDGVYHGGAHSQRALERAQQVVYPQGEAQPFLRPGHHRKEAGYQRAHRQANRA